MTYPETNAPLRTDASLANRDDEDHYKDVSPLTQIQIGMVSQIPLEFMHLVCLGVMKRLLLFWMKESKLLGIVKVSNLEDNVQVAKRSGVEAKCVIFPYKNEHVIVPCTDAAWTEYKYAVVEFLDERGVEAVPVRWLTNDEKECFLPQFKNKNSTKTTLAIKVAIQPTKEFSKFPVRVYKRLNRKFLPSDDSSKESSETEMPVVQKRQSPWKS
uniref:Uncharacterized protein n=1 Tax=Magallana gigas TaxID=29159 RepID=A0A8W8P634_MAGGI